MRTKTRDGVAFIVITVVAVAMFFCAVVLRGQEPVHPTEVEQLTLQNLQKDAIIAQQQLNMLQAQVSGAQERSQSALKAYQEKAEAIKKAHGWGSDVTFDPQTVTFTKAKVAAKPEPSKAAPPKKK